jgi:hypothetical protein
MVSMVSSFPNRARKGKRRPEGEEGERRGKWRREEGDMREEGERTRRGRRGRKEGEVREEGKGGRREKKETGRQLWNTELLRYNVTNVDSNVTPIP